MKSQKEKSKANIFHLNFSYYVYISDKKIDINTNSTACYTHTSQMFGRMYTRCASVSFFPFLAIML